MEILQVIWMGLDEFEIQTEDWHALMAFLGVIWKTPVHEIMAPLVISVVSLEDYQRRKILIRILMPA